MSEIDQLKEQISQLTARVVELEERVVKLESNTTRVTSSPSSSGTAASAPASAPSEGLIGAIAEAFRQIGEGDAGAIRQVLAKTGFPEIIRSDVNKALYANKNIFEIARQEGMKPIWRLANRES
jgi:hypothetical protein